jgi:hypothetical protein
MKSMKAFLKYILFFSFIIGVFGGCDDFRNPDQIPAFLFIDYPTKTPGVGEGASSHNITEAYLYINDEFLGAYTPGRSYPVLNTGRTKITIFFGIRMNNLDDMPNIYNIYGRYEVMMDFEPGRTDTIRPDARYAPAANFVYVEDFEGPHIYTVDLDNDPATSLRLVAGGPAEGGQCGMLTVTEANPVTEVGTEQQYLISTIGNPVFMEIDYRGNTDLYIGLIGYDNLNPPLPFYKIHLFPRDEWRKVYIELTEEIIQLRRQNYRFTLMAIYNPTLNITEQQVFVDNIKLIKL